MRFKIKTVFFTSACIFPFISVQAQPLSGPRIEVKAGYDSLSLGANSHKGSGLRYGVGAGYDFPIAEKVAFGVDAELAESSGEAKDSLVIIIPGTGGPFLPLPPPAPSTRTIDINTSQGRELYIGNRLSLALNERIALYAKAGYSNLQLKSRATAATSGPPVVGPIAPGPSILVSATSTANIGGVRLGLGGEVSLGKTLFLGLEYAYSNYEQGVSRNQIMAGVGTRF